MSEYGLLTEIRVDARTTAVTVAAAVSDTELVVDAAGDFDPEDGGTLEVNGTQLAYTGVVWGSTEDDDDTIVLTDPLTAGVDVDDQVAPVIGGKAAEDWWAVVDHGGGPVEIPLTYEQRLTLAPGMYPEPIPVEFAEDLSRIYDLPGRAPSGPSGRVLGWNTDGAIAAADDVDVPITLTHEPISGTLHVRKNGVDLAPDEWVQTDLLITVSPSAAVVIREDDRFTTAYLYDTAAAEVGDQSPPVGSLFDEIMARTPVGFWNYEGDYTDDSGNAITLTPGGGNAFVSSIIPTEPGGQSIDMNPNLSWAYSGTPVAAVDAIDGVLSYVAMGHYVDGSVDGYFIGQAAPSGSGHHHFLIGYLPVTEEVTVKWYDGSTRTMTLDAVGTFDVDVLFGITADGTDVILYVNGVEVDRVAQDGAPQAQAAGNYVAVGTDGATNNRWRGVKDGDALFDTALTPTDHLTIARAAGVA